MPPCKKTCPSGSVCNQTTGRCNKIKKPRVSAKKGASPSGKKECKKACPPGSVCNQTTGRCNKIRKSRVSAKKTTQHKRTHLANLLRSDDSYIQHPFYKRAIGFKSKENCDKDRLSIRYFKNPLLGNLCDFLPLKNIKYILGPINYSEYEYNGKNICIFGEIHRLHRYDTCSKSKDDTVYFHNFLQTLLISNPQTFYDFFLETDYKNKNAPVTGKHMESIFSFYYLEEFLKDCLSFVKNCPYKNLRAHYTDTRAAIIPAHDVIVDMYCNPSSTQKIDVKHFKKNVISLLKSDKILLKELSKSYLGGEILQFCIDRVEKIYKKGAYNIVDLIIFIGTVIMDAYLLARVFRKFKKSTDKPEELSNIIIYAGDYHAQAYDEFMESILGLKPKIKTRTPGEIIANKSSCLDVSKFKHKSVLFN